MIDQLKELEERYPWHSLIAHGHEWRWLDTSADGPVAILLPGSVGDGAMFAPTLLSMGRRSRLIAVTYPALSDPDSLAHGLAAVMDHIGLSAATIVGSSFAAYWAQFFALHYPERVSALVIGNGFTDGSDLAANPLFDRDYVEAVEPAALHREWLARVRNAAASPLQQLQNVMLGERQSPVNLHSRFLGVVRSVSCPPLGLPDSSITVLDCDDDPLIPLAARKRLRDRYPAAHHVSLEKGGHYPHALNAVEYESVLWRSMNKDAAVRGESPYPGPS